MINVTKTFLPAFEEYTSIMKRAWDKAWITNNGALALELEEKLKSYLRLDNLLFAANGTVALQIALKALNVTGEVITTPFSYVATTTAILWENCKPVFVDINNSNFCIDETKIEAAITEKTQAILATHVYGYPCNVRAIEVIAKKYNLKVIYDAAHAFGTEIEGHSIFSFGDISTCSFHAPKLFHTVEGGCMVAKNQELNDLLLLYRQFGHIGENYYSMGINAKNSEFHAAMGLANLKHIDSILQKRKEKWLSYYERFEGKNFQMLQIKEGVHYNYAYFPLIFPSEALLLETTNGLARENIFARRYFHPAINTLHYINYQPCPIAESVAKRVLCLPLFFDLEDQDQDKIIAIILQKQLVNI